MDRREILLCSVCRVCDSVVIHLFWAPIYTFRYVWAYQAASHRRKVNTGVFLSPPPLCGACLNFYPEIREENSQEVMAAGDNIIERRNAKNRARAHAHAGQPLARCMVMRWAFLYSLSTLAHAPLRETRHHRGGN